MVVADFIETLKDFPPDSEVRFVLSWRDGVYFLERLSLEKGNPWEREDPDREYVYIEIG